MKRQFKDLKINSVCYCVANNRIFPLRVKTLSKHKSIIFTNRIHIDYDTSFIFNRILDESVTNLTKYDHKVFCNQSDAIREVKNNITKSINDLNHEIIDSLKEIKTLTNELNSY